MRTDETEVMRRHTAMAHYGPVSLTGLMNDLGIEYRERAMHPDQSGFFAQRNGRYIIGVNADESRQRKRFTAAHELGHYFLHRDLLEEGEHFDRLFGQSARDNPAWPFTRHHEIQANKFAADLLMPARAVFARFAANPDVYAIAKHFGVSAHAAEIRLNNLGLI